MKGIKYRLVSDYFCGCMHAVDIQNRTATPDVDDDDDENNNNNNNNTRIHTILQTIMTENGLFW